MLTLKSHPSLSKRASHFILRHKYLLLALFLSGVVFHRWLSADLFSYADGWYEYADNLREYLRPSVWTNSIALGGFEQNLWRAPLNLLFGIPGIIGWDYAQSSKLLLLLPVIVLPVLSSYLLIRYLFHDERAAFVGSLIFAFNTYFLGITTQGHMLLTLAFSLGVLGFYFVVRQYDTPRPLYILAAILLLFACAFTDFRSFYLTIGLIAAYTLFALIRRHIRFALALRDFSLIIVGVATLNAYWVLPAIVSDGAATGGVLNRPLFAPHFWTLIDAMVIHHPFWNGADTTWFVQVAPPWYFWCIPVLALVAVVLWPKNKFMIFFGIVALVGVFLAKSSNAPFGDLYQWAYIHVPGFSAFRESTKFYFYTALAYAVLSAGLVHRLANLKLHRRIYERLQTTGVYMVIGGVLLLTIVVALPYITDKMTGYMQPRTIASDYTVLKEFLERQPDYFRTFWLPTASRWGLNTNTHPAINAVDLLNLSIQGLDTQYADSLTGGNMVAAIKNGRLANILDVASVKYVIVPLDDSINSDDFFHYYKTSRNDYIAQLDRIDHLKRLDIHTKSLAVYENTTYEPHVSVSDAPYVASAAQNMGKEYSFLKASGVSNPLFVDKGAAINEAGSVRSLFATPSITKTNNRTYLQDSFHKDTNDTEMIYKNVGVRDIVYSASSNKLTIVSRPLSSPTINNNVVAFSQPAQTILANTNFHPGTTYLVLDNTALPIQANRTVNIGASKLYRSAGVYEANKNAVTNSAFDSGLWQSTIGDCDNYDHNAKITQSIVSDSPSGGRHHTLELEATRHVACTSTTVDVTPNAAHAFFNLDYKGIDGAQQAGFHVEFNDVKKTMLDERLVIGDDQWSHLLRYIMIPSGATKATIYLYAYESDGVTANKVRYTNVSLSSAQQVAPVTLPATSNEFAGLPLSSVSGDNTVRYDVTDYGSRNLVADPSFEHGPWQSKVSDCNNYDAQPKIAQSINANSSTNGSHSLQLEAKHHTACTDLSFPLDVHGSQLLSFDYQSPDNAQAGYYVIFNDPSQSSVSERLPLPNGDWKHFEKEIVAPAGATAATLYLYAYESDGVTNNIVRYDNVGFVKIPGLNNRFYATSKPTAGFERPSGVNFQMLNPGEYIIDINGAKRDFLLNLGENYAKGWKIAVLPVSTMQTNCTAMTSAGSSSVRECANLKVEADGRRVGFIGEKEATEAVARHIKTNDFTNGWVISPAAVQSGYDSDHYSRVADSSLNFRLIAYYEPEAYFNVGAVISGLGAMACVVALAVTARYGRFSAPSYVAR